jgi:transcriptional regulator with XRE-family HTH domain
MKDSINMRITQARKSTGKTQNEFATACGITQQALSKIESGKTESPTADFVGKVAELAGCSIEWLITGKERSSDHPDDTPPGLKALFQEIKLAYNCRSLSPALVSSFRNMFQALNAQTQDIATTAEADAKTIKLGKQLSAKAISAPPAASNIDKTDDPGSH